MARKTPVSTFKKGDKVRALLERKTIRFLKSGGSSTTVKIRTETGRVLDSDRGFCRVKFRGGLTLLIKEENLRRGSRCLLAEAAGL